MDAPPRTLAGRTLFVTGASRGIGLAIARRAARDGANIVIVAKTDRPHRSLPGTIHTAAREIEAAGGRALPLSVDIRDEAGVEAAARAAVATFGGIDIVVNNASAVSLTDTAGTPVKRLDLMLAVNLRGAYLCTASCLQALRASARAGRNPQVLTLAPPPTLEPRWYAPHVAYTLSKMGMSLSVIGHAAELAPWGISVNALWPRTFIATSALDVVPGIDPARCRTPEIVADAAHVVLTEPHGPGATGRFLVDEDVLRAAGLGDADLERYRNGPPGAGLLPDLFLDDVARPPAG